MDSEYLQNHIGVPLTLALAEVCEKRPVDPIEYISHWLTKYVENLKVAEEKKALEAQLEQEKNTAVIENERQQKMKEEAAVIEREEALEKAAVEAVNAEPRPVPPEVKEPLNPVVEGDETEGQSTGTESTEPKTKEATSAEGTEAKTEDTTSAEAAPVEGTEPSAEATPDESKEAAPTPAVSSDTVEGGAESQPSAEGDPNLTTITEEKTGDQGTSEGTEQAPVITETTDQEAAETSEETPAPEPAPAPPEGDQAAAE